MTITIEYDQVRMMNQSVNDCFRQNGISEDVIPLTEL